MASRPHFLAAWEKQTVPSPGGGRVQIYVRPCRQCGGTYVWQYGCKTRTCATGSVIKSFFYGIKIQRVFARGFCLPPSPLFFALMGFEQIRHTSKISCKPKQQPKRHLRHLPKIHLPVNQRLPERRRGSILKNLNFDSSICLGLSKVLFFGMKCSVFGRSFSGMII